MSNLVLIIMISIFLFLSTISLWDIFSNYPPNFRYFEICSKISLTKSTPLICMEVLNAQERVKAERTL